VNKDENWEIRRKKGLQQPARRIKSRKGAGSFRKGRWLVRGFRGERKRGGSGGGSRPLQCDIERASNNLAKEASRYGRGQRETKEAHGVGPVPHLIGEGKGWRNGGSGDIDPERGEKKRELWHDRHLLSGENPGRSG